MNSNPKTEPAADPVTALVRIRAEIVRFAHEVDYLADMDRIGSVRAKAPHLAERLRQIAMRAEYVEASTSRRDPGAVPSAKCN